MTRNDRAPNAPSGEAPERDTIKRGNEMSDARRIAIEAAIEVGSAQSIAHALFKHRAGVLTLPD